MIIPSLLCAYVRCFLLCAQCTPGRQDRATRKPLVWKRWGHIFLFTLVPLYREMHRTVHTRRSIDVQVQRARVVLRRFGA